MTGHFLEQLFEHNNWANNQIIQACLALSDEQLDAQPKSATAGSIRTTLSHLVSAQRNYLRTLTLSLEGRLDSLPALPFIELQRSANVSGEGLLALVRDESNLPVKGQLRTRDGHLVEPWVLMVQIINHATEHREQIKSMLSAMGVTPPNIDGWDYGEFTHALIPIEKENKG